MEDEDRKLHIPIPNRHGDQFKLASEASAFRSAMAKPQLDSKQSGPQSSFSQSMIQGEVQKKEEIKPMQFHIELNLDDNEHPEKPVENNDMQGGQDSMNQDDDDDDDDDDDLFGDNSEKSGPTNRDDGKMLDKRGEVDNHDDDDLFVGNDNSLGRRKA